MKKTILLAGAALFSLGGTAIAQADPAAPAADPMQQTQPPAAEAPSPDAGATTTPVAPEATTTTAPTTATEGAAATTTDTSASGTTASGTASAAVQADWAKYDPENSGSLTPLQFGKWILASRGQDLSAQVDKSLRSKAADLPAVKVLNATSAEFAKADTDKDRKVSQAELTAYLSA